MSETNEISLADSDIKYKHLYYYNSKLQVELENKFSTIDYVDERTNSISESQIKELFEEE